MSQRFPKVFVLDPAGKWNSTAGTKPNQLADKEAGAFLVDGFGVIGNNIGATPTPAAAPRIQIHQNIGDNKFGTVRTQTIETGKVRAYYGQTATAAATEIWTIGYDGVNASKTITVDKGETIQFRFHLFSNKLSKWYNNVPGYNKTVSVYTGDGTGAADPSAVADALVIAINNSNLPLNDFPTGSELETYVVASKITGGAGIFGVKVETKAITPELLNAADPIKFLEVELVTFTCQQVDAYNNIVGTIPVTKTQSAVPGKGYPVELAALEAESQGFDRVREVFENPRYMKTNYVILAADGKKYDYIFLQYDYDHNTGAQGASQSQIREPYTVIIAAPTTTLTPVAAIFNAWLSGIRPAVTV